MPLWCGSGVDEGGGQGNTRSNPITVIFGARREGVLKVAIRP
jgi:hypothetical protein